MILKKITLWLALAGFCFAAVAVLRMNAADPVPPPPVTPPPRPFVHAIGASGLVEARHENIAVAAPAAGRIAEVFVQPWDRVASGEPLLRLDDSDLQAQLLVENAAIEIQTAELDRVQRRQQRLRQLAASQVVARQEWEDVELEERVAAARLTAARADLAHTEAMRERLLVRAPMDSTVLQVNARPGEFTNPGSGEPPILLGSIDELQVRVDVDEQLAPRVREGAKAVAYLKGDPTTQPIPLDFVRIEPYVIPKRSLTGSSTERVDTRVLQVVFAFDPPPGRTIYAGQQMDVFIEEETPFLSGSARPDSSNL